MFDSIINEAKSKFELGDKGASLLASLLGLIADPANGGFAGFVGKFREAGLGDLVGSWINDGDSHPISDEQLESALGAETIASIAGQSGVETPKATSALAFMMPHVVDALTPGGEMPDEAGLLERIKGAPGGIGANVGAAVLGGLSTAGSLAGGAAGKIGDAAGAFEGDDRGGILGWLLPLALLALLVILGAWFCGKNEPLAPPPANANTKPANAASPSAKAVESSFSLAAKDGKYTVSGVVPDQKTFDNIKAALEAQFGAGNVDLSGLKVDPSAKPFAAGWWDNFQKLLPGLKDWKNGTLSFAGGAVTAAAGLPAAALDQLKALFAGWKMPAPGDGERKLTEVALPDGTRLQAYPGGIEDQLVKFIQSDEFKNGTDETLKNKWFNFDDLNFKFGTTELAPESKRQLDNIVAILKAFPAVRIKVGGYTDKKGDDAANKKLSDGRAKAVKAALEKAGVGAQVPEAEGYGEQFATVAETATDEERKVDRKTAVRLLK